MSHTTSTGRFQQKLKKPVKNALIIYPYLYQNPYYVLPPIGAEYAQAALESNGIKTRLLDMRFENNLENAHQKILKTDLVCLYGHVEYSPLYGHFERNVIKQIIEMIPDQTPLIAGGKGFFDHEDPFESHPKIDIVTLGSPDTPLGDIIQGKKLSTIPNIIYRTHDQKIQINKREYTPLSEEIFPRRELRKSTYFYHVGGNKLDMLWSGYGCNNRCTFCSEFGKDYDRSPMKYRGRSAESLFTEIKTIDAGIIAVYDDNVTTNMATLDQLADLLIKNRVHKNYVAAGRVSHILKAGLETVTKLEKAGFFALSLGMESVHDKTLKLYKKGLTRKMLTEVMGLMNKTNIIVNGTFLLGSPGESEKEILEIAEFARKHKLDNIGTNRLRIDPDSLLYHLVYDAEGNPLPGLDRIEGDHLAKLKYKIKFGQRNPLRIMRTFLKLYKNRGFKTDPGVIISNALGLFIRKTWLEKSIIVPVLLKTQRFIFALPFFRPLSRALAHLIMPVIDLLLYTGKIYNKVKPRDTDLLADIFLNLKSGVFEKHRELAQRIK